MNKHIRNFFADTDLMMGLGGLNLTLSVCLFLLFMLLAPHDSHGVQLIAACAISSGMIITGSAVSVASSAITEAYTEHRVKILAPRIMAIMELDEYLKREALAALTEPTATATPTVAAEPDYSQTSTVPTWANVVVRSNR